MKRVSLVPPEHPHRAVIVDDYQPWVRFITTLLQNEGIDVVGTAEDGEKAIDVVGRLRPHIVLLDIGLPRLNGLDALTAIHRLSPSSKIVMVTQECSCNIAAEALSRGADGYVVKASAARDFIECIRVVNKGAKFVSRGLLRSESLSESEVTLTRVERYLLQVLREEGDVEKIVRILGVDKNRVELQLEQLAAKLHLNGVQNLIVFARALELEE
jgi:DNA-binding NarL/FixJ family response regulator